MVPHAPHVHRVARGGGLTSSHSGRGSIPTRLRIVKENGPSRCPETLSVRIVRSCTRSSLSGGCGCGAAFPRNIGTKSLNGISTLLPLSGRKLNLCVAPAGEPRCFSSRLYSRPSQSATFTHRPPNSDKRLGKAVSFKDTPAKASPNFVESRRPLNSTPTSVAPFKLAVDAPPRTPSVTCLQSLSRQLVSPPSNGTAAFLGGNGDPNNENTAAATIAKARGLCRRMVPLPRRRRAHLDPTADA
mmetsp:Transcript_111105/g.313452  ORF Transcript_111105/g.313452 Transcript_111105/m.313452 type:complete len:243 (+) Transcript_111105:455-1183(+)